MTRSKEKVAVIVLLAETGEQDVAKTLALLRAAGLEVEETQAAIGTVTGRVASGKVDALSRVPGVQAVEESQAYQLAPPDSSKPQ